MAISRVLPPGCHETHSTKDGVRYSAVLSDCGQYRYELTRKRRQGKTLIFCGLNPSTGDGVDDDPTIRRCMGFAWDMGFGSMRLVNLFAFRSAEPAGMLSAKDPFGPLNLDFLKFARDTPYSKIVAAWGVQSSPMVRRRATAVLLMFGGRGVFVLGTAKDGSPRHPLYVRADARLQIWQSP